MSSLLQYKKCSNFVTCHPPNHYPTSMGGLATFPFVGAYCASKHALDAIVEAMHMELAPYGVKTVSLNQTGF